MPDLFWDNDAFSFPEFVPSQFLDTDVSLRDLFQQAPPSGEFESQAPLQNMAAQLQTQNNSEAAAAVHADLEASPIPERPPKFPSVGDQLQNNNLDTGSDTVRCPWAVSSAAYKAILNEIMQYQVALPGFSPPSRCALVRYLEGYFRGFQNHLPFIHPPTFDAGSIGIELLLAMTAVGAMYRFEYSAGHHLYGATRSVLDYRLEMHRRNLVGQLTHQPQVYATTGNNPSSSAHPSRQGTTGAPVDEAEQPPYPSLLTVQALIILMVMSSWGQKSLIPDSMAMSSQLAFMVREIGMHEPDNASGLDLRWLEWVSHEQRRRTLMVAYIIFNLHSIAFNVPPMILTREVTLDLPSCEAVWNSASSVSWERHRVRTALHKRGFTAAMNRLLNGQSICDEGAISAFSNYVLIHGLVQKIYFEIQDAVSPVRHELHKSMETALRCWQCSWEATWESTLDPCSPKGPLGFNATALLRLAYIRLNSHVAMCHDMISGDPDHIKRVLFEDRRIQLSRSPSLDRAVLQCIHALSIPVRVGIPYVTRTQTLHWSIQHFICHLECAVLLTLWMQKIAEVVHVNGLASLREDERKLLAMAQSLVQETHLREAAAIDQGGEEENHVININCLVVLTSRLWAEISGGIHVFDFVRRIGNSLGVIADVLESQVLNT